MRFSSNYNIGIKFERKLKISRNMYGFEIISSFSKSETTNEYKEMEVNDYHRKLGHLNEEIMRNTAKNYKQELKGKMNVC